MSALDAESIMTESVVRTFLHHDSIGRVVDTVPGNLHFADGIAGKLGQVRAGGNCSLVGRHGKGNDV